MLLADKDRVEYDNKQNLLTLQYSEMDYHLSRCLTLGLQVHRLYAINRLHASPRIRR